MPQLDLGPFQIERPLGQGAMGQVWLARHAASQMPVAIKHLPRLEPRFVDAFRREVEAVARLHHAGVVMLYDHGTVTPEIAERSQGTLTAGGPWVAMEYASAGSLADLSLPNSWPALRNLLLAILDGLAHAHARGVIHRDLKPANILVCSAADQRPGLKLADFGLAWITSTTIHAKGAGTPSYMAPEQAMGSWWDFGPWTDLYAVGGLAWALATGSPPFVGEDPREVARMQVSQPLPEFRPRLALPEAFPQWVRSMMQKRVSDRPHHAADCARALVAMGEVAQGGQIGGQQDSWAALETLIPSGGFASTGVQTVLVGVEPSPAAAQPVDAERGIGSVNAIPSEKGWRTPVLVRPKGLNEAGLGLFGVRPTPFSGRWEERERLWAALCEVRQREEPMLVTIEGVTGVGKTRLARWLGERAGEIAVARWISVPHGDGSEFEVGPAALAEELLQIRSVRPDIREQRTAWLGDDAESAIALALGESTAPVRDARRLLFRWAHRQPLILHLDDLHAHDHAIQLANTLLDGGGIGRCPVLIVATINTERLEPHRATTLARLQSRAEGNRVSLGPLPAAEMRQLVNHALPLADEAVEELTHLTGGIPLLAEQVLCHWVDQNHLDATAEGFILSEQRGTLEGSIAGVWRERLTAVLANSTDEDRRCVVAAACLGTVVDLEEWKTVCTYLGTPPSEELLDILYRSGVMQPHPPAVVFAHASVRQALVQGAPAEVREECEAACARAMDSESRGRKGLHLIHAGLYEESLPHGFAHCTNLLNDAQTGTCMWWVDKLEWVLDELSVPESDVRRGRLEGLRVGAWANGWQTQRCIQEIPQILERVRQFGWPELKPRLLYVLGRCELRSGLFGPAKEHFQQILECDGIRLEQVGLAHKGLGQVAQAQLDLDEAQKHYEAYHEIALETGDLFQQASSWNDRGNVHSLKKDYDAAEACIRKGLEICEEHGFRDQFVAHANLLGLLITRGLYKEGQKKALEMLRRAEEGFNRYQLLIGALLVSRCSAALADWSEFDQAIGRLRTLADRAEFSDRSMAGSLKKTGEACVENGSPQRSLVPFQLAHEIYTNMGLEEEAAWIRAQLAEHAT